MKNLKKKIEFLKDELNENEEEPHSEDEDDEEEEDI